MDNIGTLTVGVEPAGGFIEVSLCYTGKGIPVENKVRIFDSFLTTNISGGGPRFILSIIKGILTDHPGAISFESKVNEGTIFYVKLPINKA